MNQSRRFSKEIRWFTFQLEAKLKLNDERNMSSNDPDSNEREMQLLSVEKRFEILEEVIGKIKRSVEDNLELSFTTEECKKYVSCSRSLSSADFYGRAGTNFLAKLFATLHDGITTVVLPSLKGKEHDELLKLLLETANKYKKILTYLVMFSTPLDEVLLDMLCHLAFDVFWTKVEDAIIFVIKQVREGQVINRQDLAKETIKFCVEIQNMQVRPYYKDLERAILSETTNYYSKFSSESLACCTFGGYIKKACLCIDKEKKLMGSYLNEALILKVLEIVKCELFDKHVTEVARLIPTNGLGLVKLMPIADD